MSTPLSTLINEVMPELPGCPYPLIERKVKEALQDFCERTWLVNRSVVATTSYTLDTASAMANFVPCGVMRLRIDDVEYEARRVEVVGDDDEMTDIEEAGVKFWYPDSDGTITFMPFEVAPTTLRARVAFKPTMSIAAVEDLLYQEWHETINAGVKSRLMLMPGKKWSNAQLGGYWRQEYEKGVGSGKARTMMSGWDRTSITRSTGFI
jgi:hypothetical protein